MNSSSDYTASTAESCWVATAPERDAAAPLSAEIEADVAIIGAGIVGLTAALLLQSAGRSVVVLEAARLGRQVTGGSTAKVTSQHGLVYDRLAKQMGTDAAAAYARSNEAGLAFIADRVRERGIDCEFERCPAYVYAYTAEQEAAVEREVAAASRAGLPARLVQDLALPFKVRAAVCFDEQAQFHPMKYLTAIAAEIGERGGRIFEATRVVDVDNGQPCTVVAEHGKVRAQEVIVATNIPILDRGGFFGRAFPYRHMCIAAPVAKDRVPQGMYISAEEPIRSFRSTPWSETERLMVFIGEAFPTGQADTRDKLSSLESFAREHFGVTSPAYRWGNQDFYSADGVPFVGPILPGVSRIRIATGFNAWGITAGTVAAMILSDDMLGRRNDWAWLYDSRRLGLRSGGRKLVEKNIDAARNWVEDRLHKADERSPSSIRPDEAAIVRLDGQAVAAYRDGEGVLHSVSARCTHMGCLVHWNSAERSWDCPCHGSRYDVDGNVLHGPAVHGLKPTGVKS
jgi:glycine/D-amino acid oxidase-like deaminating enzyme/nitrite reductase/ring-hydroxylating ferredoxin subunit